MMEFALVNVNPKHRKTTDCATRAVCQACNIPYKEAAQALFDEWMRTGYEMTSSKVFESVLTKYGFTKHGKPLNPWTNKTYSVGEIYKLIKEDEIAVVQVANHYTVVKGGRIIDLWDCSPKSIYRYYTKKASCSKDLEVYGGEIKAIKQAEGRRVRL